MSTFKPYWQKHKWQRRFFISLCLLVSPIVFPAIGIYGYLKEDFMADCKQSYIDLWGALKEN